MLALALTWQEILVGDEENPAKVLLKENKSNKGHENHMTRVRVKQDLGPVSSYIELIQIMTHI